MRITVSTPDEALSAQDLYDLVKSGIEGIESDTYEMSAIVNLLGQGKKFLEVNYEVV